jgi:hypothetical protein
MPLPSPVERDHLHTRRIRCEGFKRADGLWDLEGRLTDTKSYDFDSRTRGRLRASEKVHLMRMRLTLDDDFVVREVHVSIDEFPFPACPGISHDYKQLVGLTVGPQWGKKVSELFGGVKGCLHITELAGALAHTAFQTMGPLMPEMLNSEETKPPHLDSCHALNTEGPAVREFYPTWYRGE